MKFTSLLLSLSISHAALAPTASPPPARTRFSAQEVRSDFLYLYQTLQSAHYNLFAHTTKAVFDTAYRRLDTSIHDSLSLLQVHQLFQPFVLLANMGHCRVDPAVFYQHYGRHVQQQGKFFPLEVVFDGERVLISKNNSSDAGIGLGDELVAIDNQPIRLVLQKLYPSLPGDRPYLKRSVLELFSLPGMMWYCFGAKDTYQVQTRAGRDGPPHSVTVAAATQATLNKLSTPVPPPMVFSREVRFSKQVAYLRPGPFFNMSGGREYDNASFVRFVDSTFREIKRRRVQHLIIDLRGNPGGDNSFSDPLVAYFATRPFRFCARYSLKTSAPLKRFWSKEIYQEMNPLTPDVAAMQQAIIGHADGARFRYVIPAYPPRPVASRFTGKVYVLVNRHSQSNTVTTAALIQDYGFGKIIGEETADLPTSYGSMARFSLPTTRLGIDYPKGYFVRPNGSEKLVGVVPDYPAKDDLFTKEDETLTFAMNLIKGSR